MESTKHIRLNSFFIRDIFTRSAVEAVFNFPQDNLKLIELDFKDIYFISSSSAHQVVIEIDKLKRKKIEVKLINVNQDIDNMLKLASMPRKNIFTLKEIEQKIYKSRDDLNHFLLSS